MAKESHKRKLCFVIGPIGDSESDVRVHADWLLEEIVEPVFRDMVDYDVVRADKISQPGMIDAQVIRNLIDADLVIADLSMLNPNAFYEIGIRHMVQKPIIHMQLAEDKIPFDVSLYRATKFSRTRPMDLRRAREELKAAVVAVCTEGYEVDNPVTRVRGQIKLEQHATPEQRVLMEQVRSIQDRLDAVEEDISTERSSQKSVKGKNRPIVYSPSTVIQLNRGYESFEATKTKVVTLIANEALGYIENPNEILIPGGDKVWDMNQKLWKEISEIEGVTRVYFNR